MRKFIEKETLRTLQKFIGGGYFLLILLIACSGKSENDNSTPTGPTKTPKDGVMSVRGTAAGGAFEYTCYAPLKSKPVNVRYYLPSSGDLKQMPILFAFHGAERSADTQIKAWKPLAEKHGFILVAPEFTKEQGYTENDYQFGGLFADKNNTELRPEKEWTFALIEALFDYVKKETDNTSAQYAMFGHSAGGQFVNRFMAAMPAARVSRAVAANPSSWVFPRTDGIAGTDGLNYGWPYSFKNTPFADAKSLRQFYGRQLVVQIGTADNFNDGSMATDPASMAQGEHRYARAHNFYDLCAQRAAAEGVTLRIRVAEVEGVGHGTFGMVYGKAGVTSNNAETQVNSLGENSAYRLLFE